MAVASLTALKALSTTEGATVLTEAGRQGLFIWTEGDYSGPPKGPADDINIVKQDDTALTVGAWVRQQADAISFKLDAIGSTRRPTSTKLGDVVSVYDFGAIGDGEEDDTAAFQAAIDAVNARGGGSVYIPRGDYRISDTLRLYSNIELVGAGSASVIHWIKIYPDSDTRKGFIKGAACRVRRWKGSSCGTSC
ncbi:glycosyl hydrolase family 28-related protein [Sphingomonas sp. 7/4-4]|uniref:glycosyl hydrolase family 28-related protein n=1 Tax=Sphingomonas sp. 7/4-4 TaxID=3018446 RepID=UPI0022F38135|nr:glycosyl hydrolase family 28-related protein [Sphingomonas sp. 7/4-4]WBY06816.1 glycosyl hydrolase family 28-related protein [Sphingomonas sp. 7/4-4]